MSNKWDGFIHGGSEIMDDIQKNTENCYDAIQEAEKPTCCICHAPIGLIYHSEQLRTPQGYEMFVIYEFGCQQCGRLGRGGTPYLAIVDYVRKFEETVVL